MNRKRVLAVCACLFFISTALFGCNKKINITTGLRETELFKISGQAYQLSEALLVLMTEKSLYEEDLGSEIWSVTGSNNNEKLEDDIKEKVKTQLIRLKTIELLAESKGIALSQDEKDKLASAAKEYYSGISEETKNILNLTEENVLSLYTSFYMADKIYEKITEDVNIELSDESERDIQVRYIFFSTDGLDGNSESAETTFEEKESVKAVADQAKEKLSQGSDLATIANEYCNGTVQEEFLSKSLSNKDLEYSVFGLKTGEFSEVIETEDGFYIFLCVSDYLEDRTAENKVVMKEEKKQEAYNQVYEPFEQKQTYEFNSKVWRNISFEQYENVTTGNLYNVYNKWIESQ